MQTKLTHIDIHAYKGLRVPAKIVSYFFHPVFMPTIIAIVVYFLNPLEFVAVDKAQRTQILGNIALNTMFFPLVSTLLIKAVGFIESVQMRTSKDRIIPLIVTMAFYFWAYLIMKNISAPMIIKILTLGAFWGIIAVFITNIFMKISMHAAAAGGALGLLIVLMMKSHTDMFLPFLLALLIAGIIGTARLILYAHKPVEIWIGYVVGVLTMLGAYLYLV
jgi:hypothetical protein